MKASFLAALLAALFALFSPVPHALASQGVIYRCGNDYLNDDVQAQARGCRLVEGSGVTLTVTGTRVLSPAAEPAEVLTQRQSQSQAQTRVAGVPASSSPVSANTPAKTTWRTSHSSDQRTRDRDALSILQDELGKAEAALAERQRELADPQRHTSRLGDLQRSISRHLSDVAGLKREISRLPVQSK